MSFRDLGELKVAAAGTTSNYLSLQECNSGIGISSPATLPEAGTIEVSRDASNWSKLHDGTADLACPTAGKSRIYLGFCFPYIRVVIAAAGAERTFHVFGSS